MKQSNQESPKEQKPKKKTQVKPKERAKLVVKDFAEASVNKSIMKLQKQIKSIELSIEDHDKELDDKKDKLKKLHEELDELELIRNFIPSVHV